MAAIQVNVRLDPDLWAWVGKYAQGRGAKKTAVLTSALRHFQELAATGVPDLEALGGPSPQVPAEPVVAASIEAPLQDVRASRVEEVLKPMTDAELRAWKRAQTLPKGVPGCA